MLENKIALFEEKEIRKEWYKDDWYFSVVDVVHILTDNEEYLTSRKYWNKLKQRLNGEGSELVTFCRQLKMKAVDGKYYATDCADTKGILRIIQSIPSPKAEPFKQWLASVGAERIEEINDPELAVERAQKTYILKGYSNDWIKQRMLGIKSRKELTDEWKSRGAKETDYGILTNQIYKYGFGLTAKEMKAELSIGPKSNVRDSMDDISLALTNLGEVTAKKLHENNDSFGTNELKEDTKVAGKIVGNTRKEIATKFNKNEKIEKEAQK